MIAVHELAHLKERDHGKAFYGLCERMEPNYHQYEFDLRLYLTQLDQSGGQGLWDPAPASKDHHVDIPPAKPDADHVLDGRSRGAVPGGRRP